MIDCLLIGFNDMSFEDYVEAVKAMGVTSGAYRDLNLHFIEYDGRPYHCMDILNHFHFEGTQNDHSVFHNGDFMWPVILYLGTYLSRNNLSFDYVNLFHLERDRLKDILVNNDILTIAITSTMYVAPYPILEIMSFVKKYNQRAKIIIGGAYILNQARALNRPALQSLFKYIDADFYVISPEGESALIKIIRALKDNSNFDDIDNVAYRVRDNYVFTDGPPEANPLEENMVDYALFPKKEIGEFISLRASKSCPFSCAFCGYPERAGEYTYLNAEFVERELDAIRDIGTVTTLTFIDDTLNVPKIRFKEMLRMMIRNQYAFKWHCYYRCDHGDEETIELMKKAGCEGVFLGVESGSSRMLALMNKTARPEHYLEAIPKFKEVGILTHANLIVGFPGETHSSVQETIALIEETKPDFYRAQLWYCDPVTPICRERERFGIRGAAFKWEHSTMDSKTASDLVDEVFLTVKNSIWLPQNGFKEWSVFYLLRKGMPLEQMKAFLKSFDAIVRDKLLHPEQGIDPRLLDSLAKSCKFDRVA